jgi:hypothetical protein
LNPDTSEYEAVGPLFGYDTASKPLEVIEIERSEVLMSVTMKFVSWDMNPVF